MGAAFLVVPSFIMFGVALVALAMAGYIPPETYRHEQLTAMQAAFSRFGAQGLQGTIAKEGLANFLRFVVSSMNSAAVPQEQVLERSSELTRQLMPHLPDAVRNRALPIALPVAQHATREGM